ILSLVKTMGTWNGIAGELLTELEARFTDEKTRNRRDWPKSPRKLSGELRRLAPNLRRVGVNVTFGRHTNAGTPISLELTRNTSSPPSPPSPSHENGGFRSRDAAKTSSPPSPGSSPSTPWVNNGNEQRDDGDDVFEPRSNSLYPDDEVVEWTA